MEASEDMGLEVPAAPSVRSAKVEARDKPSIGGRTPGPWYLCKKRAAGH